MPYRLRPNSGKTRRYARSHPADGRSSVAWMGLCRLKGCRATERGNEPTSRPRRSRSLSSLSTCRGTAETARFKDKSKRLADLLGLTSEWWTMNHGARSQPRAVLAAMVRGA
jgi:hypothetical protein